MIAGLTGSIGTGKSTVAGMFEKLGAFVIDYDQLAREVVEPGLPAHGKIVTAFGKGVLNQDGSLNREKLGEEVFADSRKRALLNSIVHPEVFMADIKKTQSILQSNPQALILKEIPLLTQIGIDPKSLVDVVICVSAGPEIQLERVVQRGLDPTQAKARIAAQAPVSETQKAADYIIYNDGSVEQTFLQVQKVYDELTKRQESLE
jgi:dephospho-CoA kinase